jgi:branched-chain amino acid transport system substrate-binding protein
MIRSRKLAALGIAAVCVTPLCAAGAAGASTIPEEELNAWALEYTGGTASEASGDPIRFGYANAEALLPEATVGLRAAVAYINAELGGVQGRPIEIVECQVNTPEDGAACGAQFANDDSITLVLTGVLLQGNAEFYEAINGNKPLLIGNGLAVEDFVTAAGVSYTAGATGTVAGLAKFTIETLQPASVAVVNVDNAGGNAAANVLIKPAMDAAGISTSIVAVSETATAPDIASAMEAAGAGEADVFILLTTIQGCINAYDSIQSLGIDPVVVTSGLCYGTPMIQHMEDIGAEGDFPDGWYYGGYGYNYFEPDLESGLATYIAKVFEYGEPSSGASEIEYTGFAGPTFYNVMTAVKLLNGLGDDLSFEAVDAALRGFTGPMMGQAGPIECGLPPFVASCGHQMGIQQYIDGGWVSIADGLNGEPVDVTPAG